MHSFFRRGSHSLMITVIELQKLTHLYGPDDARLRGDGEGVAAVVVVVAAAEVGRSRRRLRRRRGRGHVGRTRRGGGWRVVIRRPAAAGIQLRGPSIKDIRCVIQIINSLSYAKRPFYEPQSPCIHALLFYLYWAPANVALVVLRILQAS